MSDIFADMPQGQPAAVSVGDDLYSASVSELRERIEILKAEIVRAEHALTKKQAELSEAETLFASKPKM